MVTYDLWEPYVRSGRSDDYYLKLPVPYRARNANLESTMELLQIEDTPPPAQPGVGAVEPCVGEGNELGRMDAGGEDQGAAEDDDVFHGGSSITEKSQSLKGTKSQSGLCDFETLRLCD